MEKDNLDNKDNMQEAPMEQTAEEPTDDVQEEVKDNRQADDDDESLDEFIDYAKKRVRRMQWLEWSMLAVVVCVGLSMVGWLLCGKWLQGLNNALWLFIAWMYWRQQTAFKGAAKVILWLSKHAAYHEKRADLLEQQKQAYKEKDEIAQKLIDKQDELIKALEKNQKED